MRLRHAETGETEELEVGGAFVAIGHIPRSELVAGQVDTDEEGYVLTEDRSTRTKLGGVFAVGDLVDRTYRQAVTAAGTGCMGALDAEWYLRDTPPSPGGALARRRRAGRGRAQPDRLSVYSRQRAPSRRTTSFPGRSASRTRRTLLVSSSSVIRPRGSAREIRQ